MPPRVRTASLSTKLGTVGLLLLALALGSVGVTLWVAWQLEGGAAAVNEAGRLRMQTWRLAQALGASDEQRVRAHVAQFDDSLALLRAGDPARPLFVPREPDAQGALERVERQWSELRLEWQRVPPVPGQAAAQAEVLTGNIDAFVATIEVNLARWTALLRTCQLGLMALAIASGVAMLYAGYLFVFNPLTRLQLGLSKLERGDLTARVEVDSGDELGRVAEGFNRMAATLQDLYRNLERKVDEKTDSLRAERERLAVLYEASSFVGRTPNPPNLTALAEGFARRLRTAAKADGALLRWYDADRRQHVLLGSDGVPGQMLESERCVPDEGCHCGSGGVAAAARVIPIRTDPAGRAPAPCAHFGFAAVITVPVVLHDRRLGEADLLYRTPRDEIEGPDRALLESLASHLAIGMESVRAAGLERAAAVAEERALLARELHDSIAQGLAFLKIQAQLLRGAQRRGDAAAGRLALDELDAGIQESTADVRELLVHFRTRTGAEDLVAALKSTVQKFQRQTGTPVHFTEQGGGVPLAPDVQVQLLFVVQEALSNVRKHARASAVWLDVRQSPRWRIEVRDDGRGFAEHPAPPDETHVGLRIMRERAAGVGAEVDVDSSPGRGTRVVVQWPAAKALAA